MQFSEIPGLDELKKQLTLAFSKGKVAHAQLFSGRTETAVFPIALAYATYLMCENKKGEDSCGLCANCVRMNKLIHPDIHFVFPKIAASDRGKYDKVLAEATPKFRSFIGTHPYGDLQAWSHAYSQENKNLLISREDSRYLLKNVSMRSVEGGFKIFIIWYPELMNTSSANAILKVLEEPPEKTLYFLVTNNYDQLLATITSRSQLVAVPPNTEEEIKSYLLEKGISEEKSAWASKLSEGKIGNAITIAHEESLQEYKEFQGWMLHCWNKDLSALIKRSEDFSKLGKAPQKAELEYAITMLRNAVMYIGGIDPSVFSEAERSFLSKFSEKLGMNRLERVYQFINKSLEHLERNSNPRITHLNLSIDIIAVLNT